MIKKLSYFIFTIGAVTFFCSMLPKKPYDTWWYVHGSPYYWYYQPDVYAFRSIDAKRWNEPLDTGCVKFFFHRGMHHDNMNIIYFKPTCSDDDKEAVKNLIRSSAWFEAEFPVITSYPHLSYASAAWFVLDDMLLVNFNPDSLTGSRFNDFKENYGLDQINFPDSISPVGDFTYIFEFNVNEVKPNSAIDLAKIIYLQDSGLVANVQPNLINAYEEVSEDSNVLLSSSAPDYVDDNIEYYLASQDNKSVNLFVKYKHDEVATIIRIYDLFGRVMDSLRATSKEIKQDINISGYAGGIYFASIENERGKVLGVQKFVKL